MNVQGFGKQRMEPGIRNAHETPGVRCANMCSAFQNRTVRKAKVRERNRARGAGMNGCKNAQRLSMASSVKHRF